MVSVAIRERFTSRVARLAYRRNGPLQTKRCLFSDKNDNIQIPEPTWSVKDLELTSAKEPVSEQELHRLAQKSLLDVRHLSDPDSMRWDLANMLHCLEQIKKVDLPELSEREIYDVPRGVTAAPLRQSDDSDPLRPVEEQEASQVWNSLLKPKTLKRNGANYFSIVTKRDKR